VYFIYSPFDGLRGPFATALLGWCRDYATANTFPISASARSFISSLANLPADRPGAIWLHAVSVGEAPFRRDTPRRLKEAIRTGRSLFPRRLITGQVLALQRMPFGRRGHLLSARLGLCVWRAMNAVRPSLVLILETEILPNFLREARRREVPYFS